MQLSDRQALALLSQASKLKNVVSEEAFSGVENLKLDIGASEVQIKTGTDDKIHVDDSRMKTEDAVCIQTDLVYADCSR